LTVTHYIDLFRLEIGSTACALMHTSASSAATALGATIAQATVATHQKEDDDKTDGNETNTA